MAQITVMQALTSIASAVRDANTQLADETFDRQVLAEELIEQVTEALTRAGVAL
jgi:hypothetical protein